MNIIMKIAILDCIKKGDVANDADAVNAADVEMYVHDETSPTKSSHQKIPP